MDPTEMFGDVWRWLHESDMSTVSGFEFLGLVGADALDLDLYRFNLVSSASPSTSNDSVRTFRGVPTVTHQICLVLWT